MKGSYRQGEKVRPVHRAVANQLVSHSAASPAVPAVQKKSPEEEELQMKASSITDDVSQRKEPVAPPRVNRTGMPDQLKTGIENLSGYSMGDVKVHYNSSRPAQLNALAYAQGTNIHIGPGQERHLPHEAWHVVQQKQGRVRPTMQMKDIAINDDQGLEKEADVMGGKTILNSIATIQKMRNDKISFTLPTIVQRMPIKVAIEGITHSVKMKGKSIFKGEEVSEFSSGDEIIVETENYKFSRRGPNYIEDKEEGKILEKGGGHVYKWFKVKSKGKNEDAAEENEYIREKTFSTRRKNDSTVEGALNRQRPLLANERDLLQDAEAVLLGEKRIGRGEDNEDQNLLDTTYEKMQDNLLLDINMLFEEYLQDSIEHNPIFTKKLEDVVKIIHQNSGIGSIDRIDMKGDLRKQRISNVYGYLTKTFGLKSEKEGVLKEIEDGKTSQLEGVDVKLNSIISKISQRGEKENEEKRMAIGYVKLLKMLVTQNPYFGGAAEYKNGQEKNFEYWIYHLSTLTKDPSRAYKAGTGEGELPKPMKDYDTEKANLVPFHNQRNLGTGIIEIKWEELPINLRNLMNNAYKRKNLKDDIAVMWNNLIKKTKEGESKEAKINAEVDLKALFGDQLGIPWSDAHHWLRKVEKPLSKQQTHKYAKGKYGLKNVVGVRGNILETPEKAQERYECELKGYFGEDGEKNPEAFALYKNKFSGEGESNLTSVIQGAVNEFKEKHKDWYQKAQESHKPIIGGISGHTLGYLNLYAAANKDMDKGKNPSMEILRTIMLGALIGTKLHHSYDEVMTASAGLEGFKGTDKLKYKYRSGYKDVTKSEDTLTHTAGLKAQNKTYDTIKDSPPTNSVLHLLKQFTKSSGERNKYAKGKEAMGKLQLYLRSYILLGLEQSEANKSLIEYCLETIMASGDSKKFENRKKDREGE